MTQNTTHAVMSQRQTELLAQENEDFPGQSKLDDFPTQPWGVRALCETLKRRGALRAASTCWEPAANRGFLARGLRDYFGRVYCSDVQDYGADFEVRDFLKPADRVRDFDWIITNPPFVHAEAFAHCALEYARVGVALLVRMPFLETIGRYERLYKTRRPHLILQMVERLPMVRGRCLKDASTATAYCWLVWLVDQPVGHTEFDWIAPCRARLEREGDYN